MVANHRAHDPSAGHWTVPAGGGAVATTQGGIGLATTSCMITLSLNFSQDGPYTVRYSSRTCFFFHFRQNCRYRRFFFHLRASKPAFRTLERNYPASGIIKYKFYCLLSLRCCNWLINYFSVSTSSLGNYIKKTRTVNNSKHSQMYRACNGAHKIPFACLIVNTLSPSSLAFCWVQKPRRF